MLASEHTTWSMEGAYRGTSMIGNSTPLGTYSRTMPEAIWWPWGGVLFLMSEEPLYMAAVLVRTKIPTPLLSLERSLSLSLSLSLALSLSLSLSLALSRSLSLSLSLFRALSHWDRGRTAVLRRRMRYDVSGRMYTCPEERISI